MTSASRRGTFGKENGRRFSTRSRIFRGIAVLSLGFFVYVFLRLGPERVWGIFRRLSGTEWLILLAARMVYWGIRTGGWFLVLRHFASPVSPVRLFSARLAGHAVRYLTPSAGLGGEAMRVFVLDGVDRGAALASAVVDKTIEFLAAVPLIGIAVLVAAARLALPGSQRTLLAILGAAAALGAAALYGMQRRALFIPILDGLGKLGIRFGFLEKRRERIREADERISDFHRKRKGLFVLVFLLYVSLGLLWAGEIRLTFIFMGSSEVSWLRCFLLVTLGGLSSLIPALPASLGVYELTYVSLFALLGIDPGTGVAVILARRILGLATAGAGLIPMLRGRRRIAQD